MVPPILDYTESADFKQFQLTAQEGSYQFVEGVDSDTYGFNGDILGPTIRFSEGDQVNITVNNNLKEQTTTHWHGALVPGDADGGVHNIIPAGESWKARFDVIQEAATLWYHPHQHEETARQVYQGLGGFIIIDDQHAEALPIPQDYGTDDFPVILQTKDLDNTGKLLPYRIAHMQQMHGFTGNTLLANAQIRPYLQVSTNLVRLRLLNGSSSDIYRLSLSSGDNMYVIASDGGLYNHPIKTKELEIPPAKRYEVLIDMSDYVGTSTWLLASGEKALELRADQALQDVYSIPEQLNSLVTTPPTTGIDRDLELALRMGGGPPVYTINGKLFDMERIDFSTTTGTTEYWRIKNVPGGPNLFHPFHVHATQFSIVKFNGHAPSALQEGRHDTVLLDSGDEAIIAIPFDASLTGTYMYHCHLLEHEDAGMMGQFILTN